MHALLVLGGDEIAFKEKAIKADITVCADSGADHALNQDIIPNVVIGDMDSISNATLDTLKAKDIKIISYPIEKDKTDGEIALDYIKEIGATHVDIVCAEGSIDHYMGNLYLLKYAKTLSIHTKLITSDMVVYIVDDEIILNGNKGIRISILPADNKIEVRKTEGLYYEINKPLSISIGQTIGLGNHMMKKECRIEISKGSAFIFMERR